MNWQDLGGPYQLTGTTLTIRLSSVLDGWVAAACEQDPGLAAETAAYRQRRRAQAAAGALRVIVDHADVLVLP